MAMVLAQECQLLLRLASKVLGVRSCNTSCKEPQHEETFADHLPFVPVQQGRGDFQIWKLHIPGRRLPKITFYSFSSK